jgi:uncharacterized protein (TIGR00661 family)
MKDLKIGYAFLGGGNGHASRAREVIRHLRSYGDVDLIISGTDSQVSPLGTLTHQYHGLIFHLGTHGSINYWKTALDMRLPTLIADTRKFPIEKYDLIVNDFEPITAYSARRANALAISMSHQASFASPNTPRPPRRDPIAEFIIRHYAPCDQKVGFHFEPYDTFIHTPVIRREVRELTVTNQGHFTVYLPAYGDTYLIDLLGTIPGTRWEIFSKRATEPYTSGNFTIRPVNSEAFLASMGACDGLLTGGGFESPAEALFLGKKLMMVPQRAQYEQICNAEAARRLGVTVAASVDTRTLEKIAQWATTSRPIQINYPDQTAQIVGDAIEQALAHRKRKRNFAFAR